MKKEDGKTALATLVTLVIAIIICGVIIAMIYEKPNKSTNTQNSIKTEQENNTQNTNNTQETNTNTSI